MADETTPLLWDARALDDHHKQFCALTGVPPSNSKDKHSNIGPKTLYGRATKRYAQARRAHSFMTALSNTLLLSQVVLGATLTALGASESSHILITAFGVINTVIAGLVAYLKSRGQPARQRIFRDDLERVVEEMENSEIMWLGIAQGVHGYDEIDIDDKVTVRSEVARLMRFYERAIRSYAMSNPDNYLMGQSDGSGMTLRPRTGATGGLAPVPVAVPVASAPTPALDPGPSTLPAATAGPSADPVEESPATAPNLTPVPSSNESKGKESESTIKSSTEEGNKTASDSSKDKPPTAKVTSPDVEDTETSATSTEQLLPQSQSNAKVLFAVVDPDESPATAANGFEWSSKGDSGDDKIEKA